MRKLPVVCGFLILCGCATQAEMRRDPSTATRPGQPTVSALELARDSGAKQPLGAQSIDLTLSDAIYLGLRDNRTIRSAYLDRISQNFDLRVAEDSFTPKLLLAGSYITARNQADRYQQGGVTPTISMQTASGARVSLGWTYQRTQAGLASISSNDGANITVIQPLLRGAGREIATAPVRLARLSEQINRLTLKSTVSKTISQIITTYRGLLQAQAQLEIVTSSLNRARELVRVNRSLIAAGRMAEFEIVQTEAEEASQELAQEESRSNLDRARLELLQLLALKLNTPVVATETLQTQRADVQVVQAIEQAEAFQPAWLSKMIVSEQADITLAVARNNRLWDVSIIGGANQIRNRNSLSESNRTWDNYVGVQIAIPIGDMNTKQGEVQAQVNVRTQNERLADAHQQLERDVINAVRDIGTRWRQYEIAQRALNLSRRKLEIESEKLSVGRSSNFQVLSFESDLRNAENAKLNALIGYLNAQTELDQTLGTTLQSWDISLND